MSSGVPVPSGHVELVGRTEAMNEFLRAVINPAYPNIPQPGRLSAFIVYVQQHTLPAIEGLLMTTSQNSAESQRSTNQESALKIITRITTILKNEAGNRITVDLIVAKCFPEPTPDNISLALFRNQRRKIVFHTIAVVTMLHKSLRDDFAAQFHCQTELNTSRSIEIEFSQRPILALMKQLGSFHTNLHKGPNVGIATDDNSRQPTVLDIANISMSALCNIGVLTLVWVDSLAQHLEFDADLRQLGIFRLPSFCVAAQNSGGQSMLFWAVNMSWHTGINHGPSAADVQELRVRSLVQELLCTYRLVFSQDKASRRLFRKRLRAGIDPEHYDTLLDEICDTTDSKFALDRTDFMARVTQQGTRLRISEFPHFGPRLYLLQEYMLKHRPNRLVDLYRDRRDREKFFTFWAVIVIGTLGLVLGFLQTVFSAAQFAVTYKQWRQNLGSGSSEKSSLVSPG